VLATQPLPQDEGVLRADRDDEGEAGTEAGEEAGHAATLGRKHLQDQRRILQVH
jgi:hypothetical protein